MEDTEDGYDEMTESEAVALNKEEAKSLSDIAKEASPTEIELTPGQILFNSLKMNQHQTNEDKNFKDKQAIIRYAKECLKVQHEYAINRLDSGYIDEFSIAVMAIMMTGSTTAVTSAEYTQLDSLMRTVGARIKLMATKPVPECQAKVRNAYQKAANQSF